MAPSNDESTENSTRNSSSLNLPVQNQRNKQSPQRRSRHTVTNVWAGRLLFLGCLGGVAVLFGFLANHVSTGSEIELAERQFHAIAERALHASSVMTSRKVHAAETMALVAANQNPSKEAWPFVTVSGYESMSSELIEISSGRGMALAPFVSPSDAKTFQEWAYGFFESEFPEDQETVGTFSFGRGIAASDPSLGTLDGKYLADMDGSVRGFESPNKFFAPVLQHNKGAQGPLMQSMRHDPLRGAFIDKMIECSSNSTNNRRCGGLTDMMFGKNEPGGMIIKPIYPANDTDTLVGVIVASILWRSTIEGVFSDEVRGIDCVLESDNHVYTYEIVNGVATIKGQGDLHDTTYDQFAKSATLAGHCQTDAEYAMKYKLTLYPNQDLFKVYSTRNPGIATIGAVAIIIFMSLFFFLYDFCVRQEFNDKQAILEAKRLFVRYISHEVRTPLNAACMGTSLIHDEVKRILRISKTGDALESSCPPTEVKGKCSVESFANYTQCLLQEVSANLESAVGILNDLLNYDKIEMNTMKLDLSDVRIWDMIDKIFAEFKLPAAAKNVNLKLDFSSLAKGMLEGRDEESLRKIVYAHELPASVQRHRVVGDAVRIAQTLRNLLSNAVKFTSEKGTITVAVSLESSHAETAGHDKTFELANGETMTATHSGNIRIEVIDTGAGMTQDQLDQLFRDGVQFNVNKLQAGQGSGLGLFITKGIVELHGGCLEAASAGLNEGATFAVQFPVFKTDQKFAKSEMKCNCSPPSFLQRHPRRDAEKLHVLVVDDSCTNRKLLMRLLKNRGHECEEAEDGVGAVQQVDKSLKQRDFFDTILLDYEMPNMDGPTASKEIRKLGCDSVIVGITGNVLPEDIAHFKQNGANTVLPKPIHIDALEGAWMEYGVFGRSTTNEGP